MIMAINVEPDSRTSSSMVAQSCADPEGDRGSGPPPPRPMENYKNIGFLSKTCLDPLEISRLPSSIQCWAIIGPPAKRHLNGVSLAGRRWPAYSGIWIHPPLIKLKNAVKVGPHLTKLSGSAHGHFTRKPVFHDLRLGYGEMIGFRRGSIILNL